MIESREFVELLGNHGISDYTGVPCSYLTPLVDQVVSNPSLSYTNATSEGEALSIAAGNYLVGKNSVVICQNSGLGNMVNPLTSLIHPFKIPTLIFVTWRGKPGGKDEPQHKLMGQITPDLLELMAVKWSLLSNNFPEAKKQVSNALEYMNNNSKPYAFIIEKGTFTGNAKKEKKQLEQLPTRYQVLEALSQTIPDECPVIATTGKTGREMFTIHDKPNQIYCVGSMGYANALASGIARQLNNRVYVIDGDGAALMHLGNMATIGAKKTDNLIHIILDNATYDSTGGQPTISPHVDFLKIAAGCGYANVVAVSDCQDIKHTINTIKTGPSLIYIRISPGSLSNLGRPTQPPHDVADRFTNFIKNSRA